MENISHGWRLEKWPNGTRAVSPSHGNSDRKDTHTFYIPSTVPSTPSILLSAVTQSHCTVVICGAIRLSVSASTHVVKEDIFTWGYKTSVAL